MTCADSRGEIHRNDCLHLHKNNMKIIADSGSTKTDWLVMDENQSIALIHTSGTNPYFLTIDEMVSIFAESPLGKYKTHNLKTVVQGTKTEVLSQKSEALGAKTIAQGTKTEIQSTNTTAQSTSNTPQSTKSTPQSTKSTEHPQNEIWFYGAGCTPGEKTDMVTEALRRAFGTEYSINVFSDMVGAARALCQKEEGIACILGTGSNSCLYDGSQITANVSPLGFILGDEGSGANLGKLLVGNILKDQMGANLKNAFLDETGLTPADIIDRVYRKPMPNRWLASLSPFIAKHLDNEAVRAMVKGAFGAFFDRNIRNYGRQDLPVGMVGSIAWYYQDIIREVADEKGYRIGKIMRTPLDGLQAYHG